MRDLKYSLLAMVLCLSVIFPSLSCKKEEPAEAIATFIVGNVKLYRQDETPRQVKHGDKIAAQDIIKTGRNSLFAFQVGDSAIIRITADTTVLISDLLPGETNRLVLNRGRVISSVKKLGKKSVFEVRTKTAVAAVRGTEFSVSCDMGHSVVAVKDGAVNVQRVTEERAVVEETMVEVGNAAVVTGTASKTRPANKEEIKEFAKVEKITIIEDVHEKSESELKEIEQKILHGKAAVKDEKAETAKARDKNSARNANIAQTDGDALIWTSKRTYNTSDSIIIGFKNMPNSKYCWISVAKAGTMGGDYIYYDWTYGKTDGQMIFEELALEPGKYEARAHFSRSKDISKRTDFKVQ